MRTRASPSERRRRVQRAILALSLPLAVAWPSSSTGSARPRVAPPFLPAAVSWLNAADGYVLGGGDCPAQAPGCTSVLGTRDGGRSFTRLPGPPVPIASQDPNATLAVSQLLFVNPEVGYAYGPGLWMTTDGAQHWQRLAPTNVTAVAVGSAVDVLALVCTPIAPGCSSPGLDVWRAPPGQSTMTRVAHFPGAGQWDVAMHGTVGVITLAAPPMPEPNRLWRTSDGGQTWMAGQQPCPSVPVSYLGAAAVAVDGTVLVVCAGSPGAGQQSKALYVSHDGASVFQAAGSAPLEGLLEQVATLGSRDVLMSGRAGADDLYASTNGGQTYTSVTLTGGGAGLSGLTWVTPTMAVVLQGAPGRSGPDRVLVSHDAGAQWTTLTIRTGGPPAPIGPTAAWPSAIDQQAFAASTCLLGHPAGAAATRCLLNYVAAHGAPPAAVRFVAAYASYLIGWHGGGLPVGEELTLQPMDCGCRTLVLLPRAGGVVAVTPHLGGAQWAALARAYPLPGGGTGLAVASTPALVESDPPTGSRVVLQYPLINQCAACLIGYRARFSVTLTASGRPGPLVGLGPCRVPGATDLPVPGIPLCSPAWRWPS